jgi:hypothetical protein
MLGAFQIWPKAPDFFVRAVSSSQALEAVAVVKVHDY